MKRVWFRLLGCILVAYASAFGQQTADGASTAPAYEDGRIAGNTYTNECFGISFTIPDGWQLNSIGADGKGRHIAGGGLVLLIVRQPQEGSGGNAMVITARDPAGLPPTAQEFVSNSVHGQIAIDPEHRQILRDTYTVDYAGKHFSRADYRQLLNGQTLFVAFVYTKFRGYYFGETVASGTQVGLDESAKSLQHISFREDEPNATCVMKGDDNSPGTVAGTISSAPGSSSSGAPQRVRVSQGISQGLLVKKVPPHYPEEARLARIQGQVVLQVQIDKNGDMRNVTLVSGHPLLAPAAIAAVKQWKYKPYLLEGQPVAVDTQVIVNFTLSLF